MTGTAGKILYRFCWFYWFFGVKICREQEENIMMLVITNYYDLKLKEARVKGVEIFKPQLI